MTSVKWKIDKWKWLNEITLCVAKYLIIPFALQTAIFTPSFGLKDLSMYYSLVGLIFTWKIHYTLAHAPMEQKIVQ